MKVTTKVTCFSLSKYLGDIKKRYHQESERHPTEWEKIYANHISVRGQYPEYIRNLTTEQQKENDSEKWSNGLTRNFSKEDIKMIIKQMKRCSPSLVIGKHKSNQQTPLYAH